MRFSTVGAALSCVALTVAAACGKGDGTADTTAASATTATVAEGGTTAAMPTMSPIDGMKGKWAMKSIPVEGDTSATLYTLDASGDTSSWTLTFAGRTTPVKLHLLSAAGDSVVVRSDEYESARRKGVRVEVTSSYRPQGDRVSGMATARYKVTGPDSVLMLRTEGTKMP